MPGLPPWRLAIWIQVISLPVLLVATAQWHLWSLAVNLVVAPIFSWVLLPVTVVGASIGFGSTNVTSVCEWVLVNFQNWLEWVSHWPGLLIIGQPSTLWAWALSLLSLWLLRTPRRRYYWGLLLAYACFSLSLRFPLHGAVQFIDVGQGDSILIRQPFNRQVSLIDTGGATTLFPATLAGRAGTTAIACGNDYGQLFAPARDHSLGYSLFITQGC